MKIAVIGFNDMISMPYMRFYKKKLESFGIQADYFCWDRNRDGETLRKDNVVEIKIKCAESKFGKIFSMLRWRTIILKELKKGNYDQIIVLTSLPAVLLKWYILRNYTKNYIFDIRDYTYDNNRYFKKMMKDLCNKSYRTFISSDGFRKMLEDDSNVSVIHNIDVQESEYEAPRFDKYPLNIGYVGLIKYNESSKKLIESCYGDKYVFSFYGIYKDNSLQEYCKKKGFKDIEFNGRFDTADKAKIYKNIDLVNCYFACNAGYGQQMLMPNRLYDAIYCKRPVIVAAGSFLAEYVKKNGIGVVIEKDEDVKQKLDGYLVSYNKSSFENNVKKCRRAIEKEQDAAMKIIADFVKR